MSENQNNTTGPIDCGGPAFPVATVFNPHSREPSHTGQYWNGNGMSLRDYFAAKALAGDMCSGDGSYASNVSQRTLEVRCELYYRFADAMIAERSKVK